MSEGKLCPNWDGALWSGRESDLYAIPAVINKKPNIAPYLDNVSVGAGIATATKGKTKSKKNKSTKSRSK